MLTVMASTGQLPVKPSDSPEREPIALSRLAAFGLLYALLALPVLLLQTVPLGIIAASLLLAVGLALLSTIDVQSYRLPDLLTLPLLAAGLACAAFGGVEAFGWHAASAAIGGVLLYAVNQLYLIVRGENGLGLGDAKLFAAAGAWTGAQGLSSILLIACVAALSAVVVWRLRNHALDRHTAIPFGPFLALGTWAVWLYGPLL